METLKTKKIYNIPTEQIQIKKDWNPRFDFTDQEEFVSDIKENGVLIPITVKRSTENSFVLLDGERRYRAVIEANKNGADIKYISGFIKPKTFSDAEGLYLGIICNHSKPLIPIEEANAYRRLLAWGHKVSEIAHRIGKSVTYVSNRLLLLDGSKDVQNAITAGDIKVTTAAKIIKESEGDTGLQKDLVDEIKKGPEGKKLVKELLDKPGKLSSSSPTNLTIKQSSAMIDTLIGEDIQIKDLLQNIENYLISNDTDNKFKVIKNLTTYINQILHERKYK